MGRRARPGRPAAVGQRRWIDELARKRGVDYDKTFAQRLRAAHGNVATVTADIRAATRNELVRLFAERSNGVVNKHMQILEDAGTGDHSTAATPNAAPALRAGANNQPARRDDDQ